MGEASDNLAPAEKDETESEQRKFIIFAIPKSFGKDVAVDVTQRNAIRTWKSVADDVLIFGDDPGVEDTAIEFGCKAFPEVSKNDYGTPLLSSVFKRVQEYRNNEVLVYVNSDIMLGESFKSGLNFMAFNASSPEKWMMVGKRLDINYNRQLDFKLPMDKETEVNLTAVSTLHGPSGIDYFCFPSTCTIEMPDLAVGRPTWDNWLLAEMRRQKIPVIDGTEVMNVFHQNHLPAYKSYSKEAVLNRHISRSFLGGNLDTINNSTHYLTDFNGQLQLVKSKKAALHNNVISSMMLRIKRTIQHFVGMLVSTKFI